MKYKRLYTVSDKSDQAVESCSREYAFDHICSRSFWLPIGKVSSVGLNLCLTYASSDRHLWLGADTGLAAGGCQFLAGMEQLRTLSLARTRLVHASLAGVMGGLTTLTTLSLAW